MTDTKLVPVELIERAVTMARAILKAEPLYGCVGYHGDEQISGHVEEAADLACLVLDELADAVPAPNMLAAAPKVEQEPAAYVSRKGFTTGGLVWTKDGMAADLPDETKLYTHPAPASDEPAGGFERVPRCFRVRSGV